MRSYPNVLQRQADWISVNQSIIRECDEREKTVNIKLRNLDKKFAAEYLKLREEIQKERQERQNAISSLQGRIGQLAETVSSLHLRSHGWFWDPPPFA